MKIEALMISDSCKLWQASHKHTNKKQTSEEDIYGEKKNTNPKAFPRYAYISHKIMTTDRESDYFIPAQNL